MRCSSDANGETGLSMAVSRHGYSRTNAAFKGPQARRGEVKFIQEAQPHFKPSKLLPASLETLEGPFRWWGVRPTSIPTSKEKIARQICHC